MSIVSDNLRTVLNEQNISQTEFAKTVGITFTYINMILNERRCSISRTLALLIEEIYGYSADWLLKGDGDKMKNCLDVYVKENPHFLKNLEKLAPDEKKVALDFIDNCCAHAELADLDRS